MIERRAPKKRYTLVTIAPVPYLRLRTDRSKPMIFIRKRAAATLKTPHTNPPQNAHKSLKTQTATPHQAASAAPIAAAVPLLELIGPALAGASAHDLRAVAERLEREAARLRGQAAEVERRAAEISARRHRREARRAALDAMRHAWRAGEKPAAAAERIAAEYSSPDYTMDAEALLAAHKRDRRRWTRAELAERDRMVLKLVRLGTTNREIGARLGLSVHAVKSAIRRAKADLATAQPYRLARQVGPLAASTTRKDAR